MGHLTTDLFDPAESCLGQTLRLGAHTARINATQTGRLADVAVRPQGGAKGLRFGVFPFDRGAAGWLYDTTPADVVPQAHTRQAVTAGHTLQRLPDPQVYGQAVARAVARLSDGSDPLQKVVLARALDYSTDGRIDPHAVADRLGQDSHVTSYALPLPRAAATPLWLVGATPEVLLDKRGGQVVSHPLAGSARRSADPQTDRAVADALLQSAKDLAEHKYVVDYIHDILSPYCAQLDTPARPDVCCTASMWHLGTMIRGTLRDPDTPCLELLSNLHPTPAVAGTPLPEALDVIADAEPEPRGFYAGTLGWLDGQGDGTWYVTLRCAILDDRRARLYAGAGIVADSTPEAEIAETRAKFTAMRAALGIDTTL